MNDCIWNCTKIWKGQHIQAPPCVTGLWTVVYVLACIHQMSKHMVAYRWCPELGALNTPLCCCTACLQPLCHWFKLLMKVEIICQMWKRWTRLSFCSYSNAAVSLKSHVLAFRDVLMFGGTRMKSSVSTSERGPAVAAWVEGVNVTYPVLGDINISHILTYDTTDTEKLKSDQCVLFSNLVWGLTLF